jgi:hypothetical protein
MPALATGYKARQQAVHLRNRDLAWTALQTAGVSATYTALPVAAFIRQFKTVSHAERQALLERTLTRRAKATLRNWNGWSDKGASGFMSGIDRTLRSLSSCNCRITGQAMRHLKRH